MQIITDQEIREDIQNFEKRISAAQAKLESLPEGHLGKKREQQRRLLEGEIEPIQKLIGYATEALDEHPWA